MLKEKTRQEDERLREELQNADISKLKRIMQPLIEQANSKALKRERKKRK